MPCSRYFTDAELPPGVAIVRETQRDFWQMIYNGFSKKEKAEIAARPDFEKTAIWFIAHRQSAPWFTVRRQPLMRTLGETYWGANDCNPPWTRKVKETPWFATSADADDFLVEFLASGAGETYPHPFSWWVRESAAGSNE